MTPLGVMGVGTPARDDRACRPVERNGVIRRRVWL